MKGLHVGIILDGNRRFAKRLMKQPWKGHEYGAEKVEKLFDWCKELNIGELTIYCFSLENFKRPKKEFDYLMDLFKKEFGKLKKDSRIEKNKIKIRFIGKTELFNEKIQKLIRDIEENTKSHRDYTINFAFGYGGRQEIISAVNKIIVEKKTSKITEQDFEKYLWLKHEPDLVIRTGGEKRTSNFLPWQSTYSEWIFLNKMWPEFTKEDLENCIKEFHERKRRFGK